VKEGTDISPSDFLSGTSPPDSQQNVLHGFLSARRVTEQPVRVCLSGIAVRFRLGHQRFNLDCCRRSQSPGAYTWFSNTPNHRKHRHTAALSSDKRDQQYNRTVDTVGTAQIRAVRQGCLAAEDLKIGSVLATRCSLATD